MMTDIASHNPPPIASLDESVGPPAPVGRRAVARIVDVMIAVVMFLVLETLLAALAGASPDGTGIVLSAIAASVMAYWLYEVVLVALWGQTLGKRLMKVAVVRLVDGGRPGFGRAFRRSLLPMVLLVGFFPLYPLPYIVAAVVGDHRWPHDRLAGTIVVSRQRSEGPPSTIPGTV